MSLSRNQILEANDLPKKEVKVPEWNGSVFIRTLTGEERDRFEADYAEMKEKKAIGNFRAKFLALAICDEEGKPLFTQEDVNSLGKKSARALQRLFNIATTMSGIGEKDLEEMVKN